jgi:hypothetical protein
MEIQGSEYRAHNAFNYESNHFRNNYRHVYTIREIKASLNIEFLRVVLVVLIDGLFCLETCADLR